MAKPTAALDNVFSKFGIKRGNRRTKPHTFTEAEPSSLTKQAVDNRDCTGWPTGQHVVLTAPCSASDLPKIKYNWVTLTTKDSEQPCTQRLYIPQGNGMYVCLDAGGNEVGQEGTLESFFETKGAGAPTRGKLDMFLAAIRTKPFVLLAGISGTGKSRMVRQLARGFCPKGSPLVDEQKPGNFEIIPVKPNWHDSTELMGFVTRITEDNKPKYVLTPFVKFLAKAWMNPDVPFFLCLDEMNLAPVEQYFAEYLSAIESRTWVDASDPTKGIKTDVVVKFGAEKSNGTVDPFVEETVKRLLPDYETAADGTPVKMLGDAMCEAGGIRIPSNLVVMGTVNMDETTCSFSRKVLDRAMTFELNDVSNMYTIDEINAEGDVPFGSIDAGLARCSLLGAKDAVNSDAGKVEVDSATHDTVAKRILDYIKTVNEKLKDTPFKIAYRSRDEIMVYCLERIKGGIVKLPTALDEATSMKILSRIEGDDQKLTIQVDDGHGGKKAANLLDELEKTIKGALKVANGGSDPNPECSVCSGKLEFMKGRLEAGFTNFFV